MKGKRIYSKEFGYGTIIGDSAQSFFIVQFDCEPGVWAQVPKTLVTFCD